VLGIKPEWEKEYVAEYRDEWSPRSLRRKKDYDFEIDLRERGCEGGRLKGADLGSCAVAVCGISGVDSSGSYK
jgi:hypothetical protein